MKFNTVLEDMFDLLLNKKNRKFFNSKVDSGQ